MAEQEEDSEECEETPKTLPKKTIVSFPERNEIFSPRETEASSSETSPVKSESVAESYSRRKSLGFKLVPEEEWIKQLSPRSPDRKSSRVKKFFGNLHRKKKPK